MNNEVARAGWLRRWPASALLAICAEAALVSCGGSSAPPPPVAVQPVAEPSAAGDPTGTPAPAGAPPLFTTTLKFRIPTGSLFEVSVDGSMLREKSVTQCGNDGCYEVLARNDDGNGQTHWIVQVWPQVPARFANQAEFQVTNVSLLAGATGSDLASPPLRQRILAAAGPVLGQPNPFGVAGTPEWASLQETETLEFRTIGQSTPADAVAYYAAVDPAGLRTSLITWKQANGFAADDSQDDARTVYFNAGDLALGRSMHMKQKGNGDIAYYVSNYPTVEDAIRRTNLIATVAMEYAPLAAGGPRVMKFFVFGANGQRADTADLDGNGQKAVPNLCVICHGVTKFTGAADVGAQFLPFDLSSFQYSPTESRASQEAQFKALNLKILDSNASTATQALIQAWYKDPAPAAPPLSAATQDSDAIPGNWGGPSDLYLRVVKPACRMCHVTRPANKDFSTMANFQANAQVAHDRLCGDWTMPNAKVTYQRFWLTRFGPPEQNALEVLNAEMGAAPFTPGATCP
jgi:hypothetical protein